MRDEHLIYTDVKEGTVKIVPAEGYKMYFKISKQYLSEAIASEKDIKFFVSEPVD